jgi:hypothetical protein
VTGGARLETIHGPWQIAATGFAWPKNARTKPPPTRGAQRSDWPRHQQHQAVEVVGREADTSPSTSKVSVRSRWSKPDGLVGDVEQGHLGASRLRRLQRRQQFDALHPSSPGRRSACRRAVP